MQLHYLSKLIAFVFISSRATAFIHKAQPHTVSRTSYLLMSKRPATSSDSPRKQTKSGPAASSSSPVVALPFVPANFNTKRARLVTKVHTKLNSDGQCVVLWMSRDQRVDDNHSLFYAQSVAREHNLPLRVVFNLVPKFEQATLRQFGFMLRGLEEVEHKLRENNVPFHLLMGNSVENIPRFASEHKALMVVTDFQALRVPRAWIAGVANSLDGESSQMIPLVQVDAHNVVPCWIASEKLEYSARTIRNKIQSKLPEFLPDIPTPVWKHPDEGPVSECKAVDWEEALASLTIDRTVTEVDWITPGHTAATNMLTSFVENKLKHFADKRNNPNEDVASHLSPYFHFGQLSVQRAILVMKQQKKHPSSVDSFVEEAVVRRELADNFCFYNPQYDSLLGCSDWARETLQTHSADPRAKVYSREQLERGMTHDDLWNAAQIQMTKEGKMHGFLRMYWAKKILEWTASPEEALSTAIYLNDKYELDGRDPNGYVGCMWSIGGIHDQGWGERAIFGKIRFMNYDGCKRKFKVPDFVKKYPPAAANSASANKQGTLNFGAATGMKKKAA